ncbi:organic cation transporter protein-like [Sitodiplosis mosellana]|uniref:organic cation transporter protein-like n=1 Tax=Sitodiplosis mosellana TaxID=263140 RepID=UPI0024441267|nr:organic cation transporter protein-like [Sitodiplosis mosellana]XP_055297916.1 organic cation transporter protein-like [Sitodiplosis mosellana]XP_055297917.1 organic cation transporter protein-like [Sitodiplosis mosellana]XP_055297918.1 organic cation transporter protein-like [Sitodiplosis mosellana]XP_055297919.1 organic cation transporter protein-like [Sitodiplosis mosellana]XP_055297920.1 organic cation transporter protein-like [Sitodiplosis mosellana]
MSVDVAAEGNLDVLSAEVGEFGLFQIVTFALICVPTMISSTYIVNYVFTANIMDYRCKVPECDVGDNNREISYDQPWLKYAIPHSSNGYENCVRYAPINSSASSHECNINNFNSLKQIKCDEFIYTTDESNVQTEFNIHCDDSYKLALIGSVNNIGRFLLLPLTGMLADKFGRLRVIIIGMLCCSIFGIIKSFSVSYSMYITMEFFEASAGTCTFSGIYVLAMEWLSSKYRALGASIVVTSFSFGEMLLGIVAMYVHNFRYLLRVIYTPGLFVILYFWLVPESIRWLLITGRVDRAVKILKRIAKVNGKTLSDKSVEMLHLQYSTEAKTNAANVEKNENKLSIFQEIKLVLGSQKLGLRLLNCCYQWITCCFCYYGFSLISTHIPGTDRYTSYIIVQAVEIPGALLPALFLNRFGRKKLLFCSLTLCGLASMTAPWIPKEQSLFVLGLFMIGKSSITFAFNVLYIFTAELWPTNLRTTIMNSCSMTGRLGAAVAPLTTLLIAKTPFLPFLLFGSVAIFAATLVLLCPETHEKKLPDSVEEAKDL